MEEDSALELPDEFSEPIRDEFSEPVCDEISDPLSAESEYLFFWWVDNFLKMKMNLIRGDFLESYLSHIKNTLMCLAPLFLLKTTVLVLQNFFENPKIPVVLL